MRDRKERPLSNKQPKPPDPALACAEDNPWTPVLPPDASDDDDILARLRKLEPINPTANRFWMHLKQFLRADDTTPVTAANADPTYLAPAEYERIKASRRMSFHAVGCTGDPEIQAPQAAVADAMIADLDKPDSPAFFFHLGDIVYKLKTHEAHEDGDGALKGGELLRVFYTNEFYGAYRGYQRPIFAIPGNHDGKYRVSDRGTPEHEKSPMWRFLRNFCSDKPITYPANTDAAGDPTRPTMTQPYPFFVLETPLAFIVGLYTNVCNGGALDLAAPGDKAAVQYRWLVARLKELKSERAEKGLPLILATHYPPFAGSANFEVRGNPQSALTPPPRPVVPLANVLLSAFQKAGEWPDLVISAHSHNYQRLNYTVTRWDAARREHVIVRQIPCVVAGSGGHGAVEYLWHDCAGKSVHERSPPFDAVMPPGLALPSSDHSVELAAYNDQDYGYVRVTVDLHQRRILGQWHAAFMPDPVLRPGRTRSDVFTIDLDSHTVS
jgi:hypothetical protein